MTLASEMVKKLEEELSDAQKRLEEEKEKSSDRWQKVMTLKAKIKRMEAKPD